MNLRLLAAVGAALLMLLHRYPLAGPVIVAVLSVSVVVLLRLITRSLRGRVPLPAYTWSPP